MDVGIFNLMGYRNRGVPTAAIYDQTIAQVKAAEAAGFNIAWFAEHHFSNYCVCPSPLMMLARLAGETSRIKLASGVVIVPLYHPSRLIAEIGMVDSLTHGRLILGVGSGYQPYEFERFDASLQEAPHRLLEVMAMMEKAFGGETFSHEGEYYSLPQTHIAPRPAGKLPEIWVAGDNPDLHRYAAQRDCVVMVTPRHFTPALLAAARRRFEDIWRAAGKPPEALRFGAMRPFCVTDDKAEAMAFWKTPAGKSACHKACAARNRKWMAACWWKKPGKANQAWKKWGPSCWWAMPIRWPRAWPPKSAPPAPAITCCKCRWATCRPASP